MHELHIADRVRVHGGYDYDPEFLKDPPNKARTGTVVKFIPTPSGKSAAVVKLDFPITCKGVTGDHIVLSLRQGGKHGQLWGQFILNCVIFYLKTNCLKNASKGYGLSLMQLLKC